MTMLVEDILNECIDRLAKGETVEECLARYPQHAAEIKPLLLVARATLGAAASLESRPEAKALLLSRLNRALLERGASKKKRGSGVVRRWLRPWAVAAMTLLVLAGTAGGVGAASSNSVPGEPLYPVKQVKEQAQAMMSRSDMAKARLHAKLARERAREIEIATTTGKSKQVEALAQRMKQHLQTSAHMANKGVPSETPPGMMGKGGMMQARKDLKRVLEKDAGEQWTAFQRLVEKAPSQARPALLRSLTEAYQQGYLEAIKALEQQDQDSAQKNNPGKGKR